MSIGEKINSLCKGYLIAFCIIMLIVCSVNVPFPMGEWDDYSLPIASVLNDCNFSISADDVIAYKRIFPDWAIYIDNYKLSGFTTKDGSGEMPYYFPTYAFVCIPLVWLLYVLKLPTIYCFSYSNLLFLMLSLVVVYKYLKADDKKKILFILGMSINPIVFYISWTSAEVFIFSLLLMAMVCWYNGWSKRAAILVSIAGTLNVTIMSIGIIMIVEYIIRIIIHKEKGFSWSTYLKRIIPDVVKYGCCYIIGLIPIVYNYYNIGHINLTAAISGFTHGSESTLSRFIAYLFDLNFGIFPYYPIVVIVGVMLFVIAVVKRHVRFIEWMLSFLIIVILYSIMIHINSGMSGISRYNSWGVVILLCAVFLYYDEIVGTDYFLCIIRILFCGGMVITGLIVMNYNPYMAKNVPCIYMTPIAEWVLDRFPNLYNPLFSTFNSRTNHIEGGYDYTQMLPIVYQSEDGYVRKILASAENKEELLSKYRSLNNADGWFEEKIESLKNNPSYISLSERDEIVRTSEYTSGTELYFSTSNRNADEYIVSGLNYAEEWGSWTEGDIVRIRFISTSDSDAFDGTIDCGVFNGSQDIIILVNNTEVKRVIDFEGGLVTFEFENPGKGKIIDLALELPDAISPRELGVSADLRVLGLGLKRMIFTEKMTE